MKKMILMAGPCVIESMECLETVAEKMKHITDKLDIDYYFKASFDKANRTSINSYRGPGLEKGLEMLSEIKSKYGFKIITDIHEPYQAEEVAKVADIIQIPAFLCRQTNLLVAAAKTGKIVNVKKAQFLAPWDMKNVVRKLEESGNSNIFLCERGTTFGYNRLVVDFAGIIEMKKLGYPVIYDATHSVQKPGGNGITSGGSREYVIPLAKAALACEADGLFVEVHPDPDKAESDGPNMIKLSDMDIFLEEAIKFFKLANCGSDKVDNDRAVVKR